jgi:prepilin-type N-terminal cleavage/methylation domain-containing protein/prepilin-type processing-associated H-X9-DG protein
MRHTRKQTTAFTLTELMVVIAVSAILSAVSLAAVTATGSKAQRLACMNNLKQVGLAFHTWSTAHSGRMPMAVPVLEGGDSEDVGVRVVAATQRVSNPTTGAYMGGSRGVSMMFLCMSNELGAPKVLFCPAEYETSYRQAATTFSGTGDGTANSNPFTNDLNISYFIGVDAQETTPRMLLSGDHNLGGDGNPPSTAYCYQWSASLSGGSPYIWTGTNWTADRGPAFMRNQHNQQGNVAMADGSVEWFNRSQLQDALKNSGDTSRSSLGWTMAAGATAGSGCNRIQLP